MHISFINILFEIVRNCLKHKYPLPKATCFFPSVYTCVCVCIWIGENIRNLLFLFYTFMVFAMIIWILHSTLSLDRNCKYVNYHHYYYLFLLNFTQSNDNVQLLIFPFVLQFDCLSLGIKVWVHILLCFPSLHFFDLRTWIPLELHISSVYSTSLMQSPRF